MFDSERLSSVAPGSAVATLAAAEDAHRLLLQQECRILLLAAHWADLNATESVDADGVVSGVRSRVAGGAGTPLVSEFTAAEFGAVIATTTAAAWSLIADAVDLRHRLPRLWAAVSAGGVRVWKARRVAQATRHLTIEAAAAVDAASAAAVSALPWGRFERVLDAEIIHADPAGAEERARLWQAERFVRGTRSAGGLRTVVARAAAGEVAWFLALVTRIAEILAADGDLDPADVRRSKAIGIIAQPALALELLIAHAGPDDHRDDDHHDGPVDDHTSLRLDAAPLAERVVTPEGSSTSARDRARLVRAVRPPVTLYVHLTDDALRRGIGAARIEGEPPVTVGQVRDWLGRVDTQVTVGPVVDPGTVAPVDGWEIPRRTREAMRLRQPAEVFPWGTATGGHLDIDHTVPFRALTVGGTPGQTRLDNLGPLSRSHHRAKTFGRWRLRQPESGHYLWRSPHGWVFHVTNAGTRALGRGPFARAIWAAARGAAEASTQVPRTTRVTGATAGREVIHRC